MGGPIQWTDQIVPNGGTDESKSPQKIDENKWTTSDNVEPMPDGARRRNGSAAENAALPIQAISISHETGTDSRVFVNSSAEYISQGFTVGADDISVKQVSVRLRHTSGTPDATPIDVAIYDNTADKPTTAVTGLDFAQFPNLPAATGITTEYAWYTFTATTAVTLSAAAVHHLVVLHDPSAGNTVDIEEESTPSAYSGGNVNFSTDGSTWTPDTAADLNFRIYGAAATITAIADYRLSDGSTSRHLIVADSELYKNVSGTMTALSDRDRLALTPSATLYPSWAVGQDRFMFTNNTEISKKFYVLSSTEYYENEGLAAPTTVPTLTPTATNALPDGTYFVDYYFWNDDLGIASNRWKQGTAVASADNQVITSTEHIAITGLPAVPERENDRATHIRIEVRDLSATVFRYVKQIAIGTTSVTIDSTDTVAGTIEAEYNHNVPLVHEVKCIAENRQFILNVLDGSTRRKTRLMFSAINGATPYYESFPTNHFRDFGRGDGDHGTALFFMPPRTLIVGMKNGLFAIDARRPATSDVITISREIGVAHHNAGSVIGDQLFFFSDSAQKVGHYKWRPGMGEPERIKGLDDTVKGYVPSRFKFTSSVTFAPGDDRFQWWTLMTGTGTQHNKILMYDYELKAFVVYTKQAGREGNILGTVEVSGIDRVYLGGYDGVEYQQDSGSTDAGALFAYTGKFTGKAFDFGSPNLDKRHMFMRYLAQQLSTGAIGVSIKRDYGARGTIATSASHQPGGQAFGGTDLVWGPGGGTWGVSVWPISADIKRKIRLRGVAEVFQHTFTSTSPFYLKGMQFGYQFTGKDDSETGTK